MDLDETKHKRKIADVKEDVFSKNMDTPECVDSGACWKRRVFEALRGGTSKNFSKKS